MRKAKKSKREKTQSYGLLLGLALIGATLVGYWPALNGGPIWDDDAHLTRYELRGIDGLVQIWGHLGSTRQYYPIVHSAFWLGNKAWGHAVFPYHVINVLLHCASALLVVAILRRLRVPGAWLAGAIFALHPVQVESVAWISELKNTLSGFFYFAAALVYLNFDKRRDRLSYLLSLGLFILGLLSKSVIATLPAVLLVVFWWRKGRLRWKVDVLPLLPFFFVGIASGLFTAWVERRFIGAEGTSFDLSMVERGLIAGRVLWFYFFKLLWPANLVFTYPRWHVSQLIWWQYLFPLGAALVVAGLFLLRKRSRAPLAGVLIFAGTLFPVLGFVNVYPFLYSYVADHFQYIASVGIITLFAAGISLLVRRYAARNRLIAYGVPVGLLLVLATLTWRQARTYREAQTLYQVTLQRNPASWMAHNNLGIILSEQGDLAGASAHYQQAMAIEPSNAESYTNLGNAYMMQGRVAEALPQYERALDLAPHAVQARRLTNRA